MRQKAISLRPLRFRPAPTPSANATSRSISLPALNARNSLTSPSSQNRLTSRSRFIAKSSRMILRRSTWPSRLCSAGKGADSMRWPIRSPPCDAVRRPRTSRSSTNSPRPARGWPCSCSKSPGRISLIPIGRDSNRSKTKVEELESALSARRPEFRAQAQPVTLAAVQAALPAGSALVEFAVYTPQDPRTDKSECRRVTSPIC